MSYIKKTPDFIKVPLSENFVGQAIIDYDTQEIRIPFSAMKDFFSCREFVLNPLLEDELTVRTNLVAAKTTLDSIGIIANEQETCKTLSDIPCRTACKQERENILIFKSDTENFFNVINYIRKYIFNAERENKTTHRLSLKERVQQNAKYRISGEINVYKGSQLIGEFSFADNIK
ncbi:hypothetical protein AB7309_04990 [Providencia manganoxydans]|uniref:hypothetical protein n=1 Tax=Providencia manganoxydans TaxID=2923283 RepID=UPI0034E543FF